MSTKKYNKRLKKAKAVCQELNLDYFGKTKVHKISKHLNDWKCYWCNLPVVISGKHDDSFTTASVEHIIPLSKGGLSVLSNLALSLDILPALKNGDS